MKLKSFVYASLLCGFTASFFSSCSKSCEEILCTYDGFCDNGECICTDLTKTYLVGTWQLEGTGGVDGTFYTNNKYEDSFGNVVDYILDSQARTITLSSGTVLTVSEAGFGCLQMNVAIKNGNSVTNYTFIRV